MVAENPILILQVTWTLVLAVFAFDQEQFIFHFFLNCRVLRICVRLVTSYYRLYLCRILLSWRVLLHASSLTHHDTLLCWPFFPFSVYFSFLQAVVFSSCPAVPLIFSSSLICLFTHSAYSRWTRIMLQAVFCFRHRAPHSFTWVKLGLRWFIIPPMPAAARLHLLLCSLRNSVLYCRWPVEQLPSSF